MGNETLQRENWKQSPAVFAGVLAVALWGIVILLNWLGSEEIPIGEEQFQQLREQDFIDRIQVGSDGIHAWLRQPVQIESGGGRYLTEEIFLPRNGGVERTEIENYLLSLDGIVRIAGEPEAQQTIEGYAFEQEFNRLVDSSRDSANDRLVKAFQQYGRSQSTQWDAATCSQKAREYLQAHWDTQKLALADAKEIVLPGLKRWLKDNYSKQFSDRALAEHLSAEDLPEEVRAFARKLAEFAGVEV